MHRKTWILALLVLMLTIVVPTLAAATGKVAAWDSDKLSQPLAVDGRIRHNEENTYSFVLNSPGIPEEPVVFKARLSDSIDQTTGADGTDQLFDPEKLSFVTNGFTSYIGAEVTSISPATTSYTDNGNVSEGEGSNIDLIKGATAVLTLKYNPSYTHQKGAIWFCLNDVTYSDFTAMPGSDSCTVIGNVTTDLSGMGTTSQASKPKVIRAVSIYDPWFDSMEERYGDQAREEYRKDNPDATDAEVAAMTWKTMYLRKSDKEHRDNATIWRYPMGGETTIHTDYLVTVRSPIEMVTFTAKAEFNVLGDSTTQRPQYMLYNDQIAHPDMTDNNRIWCYDTSDSSAGSGSVDAFRIEVEVDPDYGYNLLFEIVQGSAIGSLDTTELDGNTFRFVPKGPVNVDGEEKTNYGSVIIKATAEEVNFTKYFTLMYVPSNMKLVKYIPQEEIDNGGWKKGVKVDEATGLVDEDGSGEWDVVTYDDAVSGKETTQLYGMECLVLYPDEEFELAMVQYVDTDDTGKHPYYMTAGVPTTDYNKPIYAEYDGQEVDGVKYQEGDLIGYETDVVEYAVTYSITKNDDPDSELIPGVVEFERNGKVIEEYDPIAEGVTDVLHESAEDTGQSYWYKTDGHKIRGVKEGTYYLRYTVAPVESDGAQAGDVSLGKATLTGGIYLYIVSPVNQALAYVVSQQNTDRGSHIMLEIPYRISAGQRTGVKDSGGDPMPSHWYLGESRGAVRYDAFTNSYGEFPVYYGSAYGIFEDEDYVSDADDLMNFQPDSGGNLVGIGSVSFGEAYLTIADVESCRPKEPDKATGTWGGTMAITAADEDDGPDITDVRVTGPYGLARFSGIDNLRIIDTATEDDMTGRFTEANITVDGQGRKVWDFSSLVLKNYQHANMGDSGEDIEMFYAPQRLEVLNLDSEAVIDSTPANYKGGVQAVGNFLTCQFSWGANSRQNLKQLWIGNNRFQNFTISGFPALQAVFVDGLLSLSDEEKGIDLHRSLAIHDCASLEYVQAIDTAFNYLMVQFPDSISNEHLGEEDTHAFPHSILRANNCTTLFKVNVSGHLSYLELVNNPSLVSVIGSDSFSATNPDNFTTSDTYHTGSLADADIGGWVRVVNLGSLQFSTDRQEPNYIGIKGQTDGGIDGSFLSDRETNSYSKILIEGVGSNGNAITLQDRDKGSDNIRVLKFNYLYRLFSSGGATPDIFSNGPYPTPEAYSQKMRNLETVEVFALVPDGSGISTEVEAENVDTHLTSDNAARKGKGGIYSFDLKHAGNANTSVLFHHVPQGASVNLSDAKMTSVEILDFQGFLNLYGAPNIQDLHINESASSAAGKSVVEMSRSGIVNFTGTQTFKGVSARPGMLEMMMIDSDRNGVYEEVGDSFLVVAVPAVFNSGTDGITIDSVTSDNPAVCTASLDPFSDAGHRIDVVAKGAGTTTIKVSGKAPLKAGSADKVTFSTQVSVTVTQEEVPSFTFKLEGGTDEPSSDGKVKVLEFDTRDDAPMMLELKVFDETGADVSSQIFSDFEYSDPDNEWVDESGHLLTYEEGYEDASTQGTPQVVWSFDSTGHDQQEYAETVLDSYLGNRVYIRPLVDDQTCKGYVSYTNAALGIEYESSFIIRVKGGAERRWRLIIEPADDPLVVSGVGSDTIVNVTVYDTQLLDGNGDPTTMDLADLSEDIVWSLASGGSIATCQIDPGALDMHHGRAYLIGVSPGTDTVTASYRGVVKASRQVVVDGPTITNPKLESGSFSVYDGGNNRDNAWDLDWPLGLETLTGASLPLDGFISGTVRFTTSKGTFDFRITSLSRTLLTFSPTSDADFKVSLVATSTTGCSGGADCTNGIPNLGQYSDSTSKLPSTDPKHNHWIVGGRNVFDIQPEMQALLDSGTVEVVDLTFTSGGKEYAWSGTGAAKASAASAMAASIMYMSTVSTAQEEISLTQKERMYTQTFSVPATTPEAPDVSMGGRTVKVNMLGRSMEDAQAYAESLSPRLMPVSAMALSAGSQDDTVINAKVYRLVANNCVSLVDVSISDADNPATAQGLILLEASGSGSEASPISVSISQSVLQQIDMPMSKVKNVMLDSSGLVSVDFSGNILGGGAGAGFESKVTCTQLKHIDLHDNKLGTSGSTIVLMGKSVTPQSYQDNDNWDYDSIVQSNWSSQWPDSLPSDFHIDMSGNGITYHKAKCDACNGQIWFTVRIGTDTGVVAKAVKTDCRGFGCNHKGATLYYRMNAKGGWTQIGKLGDYGVAISVDAARYGFKTGDIVQFRLDADSSGWGGEPSRHLYVYPYGE